MRIKLQALTEHIHGFLLILGITAFLSCLIFPSHYLFYFFHSFLLLIPFAVTAYGQEKIKSARLSVCSCNPGDIPEVSSHALPHEELPRVRL